MKPSSASLPRYRRARKGSFRRWRRPESAWAGTTRPTRVYRDGLKRLPKNCLLWQELGSAQASRGRPEDITAALATFDQGIAAVPKCGLTYNAAARLLIAQGRPTEAKAKLDALIRLAPNSDGAVIAKDILSGIAAKS